MREVIVRAKCDRCMDPLTDVGDKPVEKWMILGSTYRVELCQKCQTEVLDQLAWLANVEDGHLKRITPKGNKGGKGVKRLTGKFAYKPSTCPICERTFSTPAGLSQHRSQNPLCLVYKAKAKPEPKPEPDDGGAQCEFCGERFATAQGRGGHEYNSHKEQWKARKENAA